MSRNCSCGFSTIPGPFASTSHDQTVLRDLHDLDGGPSTRVSDVAAATPEETETPSRSLRVLGVRLERLRNCVQPALRYRVGVWAHFLSGAELL